MENFTFDSKYQTETVSIIVSFSDLLKPGDTITGTPTVTPTVYAGLDSSPTDILYQGVSIINGTAVEQRIRLGVLGVIYQITFTVVTVAGYTLEKECYLAILPEDGNAIPTWLPLWESTQLYPYQLSDNLASVQSFVSGRLAQTVVPEGPDNVTGTQQFIGGTLIQAGVLYNIPHEDLQGTIVLIGGVLEEFGAVVYDIPHEDLRGAIALIGGTLTMGGPFYAIPHEDLQGITQILNGTLV